MLTEVYLMKHGFSLRISIAVHECLSIEMHLRRGEECTSATFAIIQTLI